MKLLVLSARFPLPLEKGDKLRLYHQLRYLSRDHEVTLVSLVDEDLKESLVHEVQNFCHCHTIKQSGMQQVFNAIRGLLDGLPTSVGYFYQPRIRRRVHEIVRQVKPSVIFVQLVRMVPYIQGLETPMMCLDYMDAFSLRTARRVELGGVQSAFWKLETMLLRRYESKVARHFHMKFVISEVDKEHLKAGGVKGLTLLRNGVDTAYFKSEPSRKIKYDLLLVGNMSYHPNVTAARYLVQKIAKPLKKVRPDLTVLIAGAAPEPGVRRLQNDWITVSGYLPDIRDAYKSSKVFVAPIFSGSGLQNKILEAMSMCLPCVTTSMVNDSIAAPKSVVQEANDAETFKQSVLKLLVREDLDDIGGQARAFVREHFDWNECCRPLKRIMEAPKLEV